MESDAYLDPAQRWKASVKTCEVCLHNKRRQRINVVYEGEIIEHYDICDSKGCFRELEALVL